MAHRQFLFDVGIVLIAYDAMALASILEALAFGLLSVLLLLLGLLWCGWSSISEDCTLCTGICRRSHHLLLPASRAEVVWSLFGGA